MLCAPTSARGWPRCCSQAWSWMNISTSSPGAIRFRFQAGSGAHSPDCPRRRGRSRRAVMVGDSSADGDAAKGAPMPFIAVSFGYGESPVEVLKPDAIIHLSPNSFPRCAGCCLPADPGTSWLLPLPQKKARDPLWGAHALKGALGALRRGCRALGLHGVQEPCWPGAVAKLTHTEMQLFGCTHPTVQPLRSG